MSMTATAEVKPKRIQRTRIKGSKLPEGTLCVTRPGPLENPFTVGMWFRKVTPDWFVWTHGDSPAFGNEQVRDLPHSLDLFRDYGAHRAKRDPSWLDPVRKAKFIACWCKESATCHADIVIELAFQ
jgi:hypothetical protein